MARARRPRRTRSGRRAEDEDGDEGGRASGGRRGPGRRTRTAKGGGNAPTIPLYAPRFEGAALGLRAAVSVADGDEDETGGEFFFFVARKGNFKKVAAAPAQRGRDRRSGGRGRTTDEGDETRGKAGARRSAVD